jgi:hypothetical protein
VLNQPRTAIIAGFSGNPELQELAGFLDVSGIPGTIPP